MVGADLAIELPSLHSELMLRRHYIDRRSGSSGVSDDLEVLCNFGA